MPSRASRNKRFYGRGGHCKWALNGKRVDDALYRAKNDGRNKVLAA
jgi:GGDEF domain-containing protein